MVAQTPTTRPKGSAGASSRKGKASPATPSTNGKKRVKHPKGQQSKVVPDSASSPLPIANGSPSAVDATVPPSPSPAPSTPQTLTSSLHQKHPRLSVSSRAGGLMTAHPIVFTPDSEYFICCVASFIKVYRVQTGQIVRVLDCSEATPCSSNVCAAVVNPKNQFQLFAFHQDGSVHLWEFQEAVVLKSWSLGYSIDSVRYACSSADTDAPQFVTRSLANKKAQLRLVTLHPKGEVSAKVVGEGFRKMKFDVAADGSVLAYTDQDKIYLYDLQAMERIKWFNHDREITVVCFHSLSAETLATGDVRGQIHLWNLDRKTLRRYKRERPSFSKLHWHAFPVQCISFSPDGTAMISGGQEAVLVVWQLESGKPRFLPRLGTHLSQVLQSPDSKHYLVGGADNTIRIISAVDFELEQSVFGLKNVEALVERTGGQRPVMAVNPHDGTVLVQASPGSLQLWNTTQNRMLMEMDVAERPRLQCSDAGVILGSVVRHVAVSKDGLWIVTVDERTTGGASASGDCEDTPLSTVTERYLKFWMRKPGSTHDYELVTRINQPHKSAITGLVFYPRNLSDASGGSAYMCATSSLDGTFKMWQTSPPPPEYANTNNRRQEGKKQSELPPTWICRTTASWRGYPSTSIDFSADGSVVAVSFNNAVTLWHPLSTTLYRVLTQSPDVHVQKVTWFGAKPKDCSRTRFLAVVASNATNIRRLTVWDAIRGSICWSRALEGSAAPFISMDVSLTVVSPPSSGTEWQVEMLDPEHSTPIFTQTIGPIFAMATNPTDHSLVLLKGQSNIEVMEVVDDALASVETVEATTARWTDLLTVQTPKMLSSLFGPNAVRTPTVRHAGSAAIEKPRAAVKGAANGEPTLVDTPSHIVPALDRFFGSFMDQFLFQKDVHAKVEHLEAAAADEMDVDVDMDMEEVTEIQGTASPMVTLSLDRQDLSWMKAFVR